MNSEIKSSSPQEILARLTGELDPQGLHQIPVDPVRPANSNFHALIIGINQYLHHPQLQGAVNDANLFKSYLLDDLLVPEENITTLFDAQATRAGIIQAFQNLATDPTIKQDDPIVVYYAGHGAEIQPPSNRPDLAGSMVQCLVPQDAGTRGLETSVTPPIPDFTIGSLLNQISNAKGDNISVIFDSCHSASVTRINIGSDRGSRAIPWQCFSPLPDDVDSDLIGEDSPASTRSSKAAEQGTSIRGMQSHILLAACSSKGVAYEDLDTTPHHGHFTKALLSVLRSVGPARLTYKSCMQRLPKIKTFRPQDPVCEGVNVNRMLFNAMVSGADNSFILLEEKQGGIYLQAGSVHGITPGCLFAIHADLVLGPTNPPLGNMVIDQVSPFESLLKVVDSTSNFTIPKPAYGRQIGAGEEHVLDLYITPEFEKVAPPDPRWKIAFSGGEKDVILRLVDKDLAELIVDVNATGWTTFTFPRLQPAVKNGIATLKRTAPTDFQYVYRVISAAARFAWHLERFPDSRPFQAGVRMEFYKLKQSGQHEGTGAAILDIDGGNLNSGGWAMITADSSDQYGFCIVNSTTRDLYAYLFYFSISTLEISAKFLPVVGNDQVDPSLPKGGILTLGYGSGGIKPFQFSLGPDEPVDVGVFKLFLSTAPIDLSSVAQEIPFRIETRRLIKENEAKHQFETLQVGIWDAITMELKLVPKPEDMGPEEDPEIPVIFPPQREEDKLIFGVESLFPNFTLEKQYTLPNDTKITYGLILDPELGPRLSSRSVSTLLRPVSEMFSVYNTVITEEVTSSGMLDASLAHIGFPPLGSMIHLPLLDDLLALNDVLQKWTTRRVITAKLNFSISLKDFQPDPQFVSDMENALNRSKHWQRLEALRDAIKSWGTVILLSGVIGYSSVETRIDSKARWPRPPPSERLGSDDPNDWTLVKVTRVASILELLDDNLQDRIKQLYAGLIFQSPCVGAHQLFGFDGIVNRGRRMEAIEIGFSDRRIERILIRYDGGVFFGPYGVPESPTRSEWFSLEKGEGITDILVWATDSHISSIQLLDSGGRASSIYGATRGITQAPKLLSGNGSFLVGLSGTFDLTRITQIQPIWRGDTHAKGYRSKQTSHVGGNEGVIWSDLKFMDDQFTTRISGISARTPGTGLLAELQMIYTSFADGLEISQGLPKNGTAHGPTVTWELNDKEWITRVRGRHDGKTICEVQFFTNQLNSSPAFGQPTGDITFDIEAPKMNEGEDMVLHYMAGKSDEYVNSILFVWAEPAESQALEAGIIDIAGPPPPEHRLNPRATFYDLCAKSHNRVDTITSFEDYSKAGIITRSAGIKTPLHALIIGANRYEINHNLEGAVQDAFDFKQYLTDDLLVPEEQVMLVLDEEANRSNVITVLQNLASENNEIEYNDPIVIYYAGYGSELDSPPDLAHKASSVRCIIPQDVSEADGILPIPEFTIGALVRKIAQAKGNNITIIFDCCFSPGGFLDETPPGARFIDKKYLPSFSEYPDRSIIQDALPGVDITDPFAFGLSLPGVDTHVFLAACGYQEAAFENRYSLEGYGYFSKALLTLLRGVEPDSLTYKSLMQRLPTLKTYKLQTPICEGKHADRTLFDAKVKGPRASFIAVKPKPDGFYLEAGLSQGITPGSKYEIYDGDIFGPSDTVIGALEVDWVNPFVAHLKGGNNLDLPALCYGRQVAYGPDQALAVHFTDAFVRAAEPSEIWSRVLCGREGNLLLRPTIPGLAQVVVSVYGENETMFLLTNQASINYRVKPLPPRGKSPIPPTPSSVVPVLGALAKWNWYLSYMPTPRPFQRCVDVEFYQLQPTGDLTDEGNASFIPDGKNLVVGGEVKIVANAKDSYGIRVTNRSSVDLYVYILSFSPTNLTLKHRPTSTIGSSYQGALLPKSESLTIGYGPGEQLPFTFSLDEGQELDV
ncbi:unnamed protein product, partial [Rhizoctonia solani]